jgi:hypothetical protein
MPMHDWTLIADGIYHHFHHSWIEEIQRTLNAGILPEDYYALAEQRALGFGPDVLTLQHPDTESHANGTTPEIAPDSTNGAVGLLVERPRVQFGGEFDWSAHQRTSAVSVRHVSDDEIIAVIEVVSPANKSRHGLSAFVEKATELLNAGVHLLILDPLPPGDHDPLGIHAAIWNEISYPPTKTAFPKPLTLVAYEAAKTLRYYLEPVAVGDELIDMPLYLQPGGYVLVPLEAIYQRAFAVLPRRWRRVLEGSA